MRRLFICRPEPGAATSVRRAQLLGLEAVAMPLFEIRPLDWQVPDPAGFDALLLTSANAVRNGGPGLAQFRQLPVVAVGEATAAAARGAGWSDVRAGHGGVEQLLAGLPPGVRLFHPRGRDASDAGAAVQRIVAAAIYEAVALPPPAALSELGGNVAALHSPRAAARLAELVDGAALARRTIGLATISSAAAQAAGEGWGRSLTAERPDDKALLALAALLCDEAGQQWPR